MKQLQNISLFILKHKFSILKVSFAISLFLLIIFEGQKQLKTIQLSKTITILRSIPINIILLFFISGLLAAATMTFYDFIVSKTFTHKLKTSNLFFISFISTTINNIVGLGGIGGATIRSYFLKKNKLETNDLIDYNLYVVPAACTGLSILAGLFLLKIDIIRPILKAHSWLVLALAGFIIYLFIYLFMDTFINLFKKNTILANKKNSRLKTRFLCVLVSLLEWFMAFLVFYALSAYLTNFNNLFILLGIFSLSSIAGIVSFVPGGVGSFDLIALLSLQGFGLSPEKALAIILLYRLFYFILPAITSVLLFTINILFSKRISSSKLDELLQIKLLKNAKDHYKTYSDIISVLLSMLVFCSGLILIVSALSPGILERIKFLNEFLSFPLLRISQKISFLIGLMLLMTSKEIFYKVKRAYTTTIYLLIAGTIFTFIKGLDYEESIFLIIVLVLLILSKRSYYRESIPIKPISITSISFIALIVIPPIVSLSHKLRLSIINKHIFDIQDFNIKSFQSGLIIYLLFTIFLILWYFTRKKIENNPLYTAIDFDKLNNFLNNNSGNNLTHLLHLKDKNIFWAVNNKIAIPYGKFNDKFVVLSDPLGDSNYLSQGIEEFQKFLDLYGYECVFYQVSQENIHHYHDTGYYFFKLGEEAHIDLTTFNLEGSKNSAFRNTLRRIEREGYCFEVLTPPYTSELLNSLRSISDEWLNNRKEKGFSLGWFSDDYLQTSSIGIIKHVDTNDIIAFVSIMTSYDNNQTISVDLMRLRNKVPNATMDYLMLNLILFFKSQGYKYYNLGMAPLSNVGIASKSHMSEKAAKLVYSYGNYFYSFDGLRKYKQKFNPLWVPKYLAYPKIISLPETLLDVAMLVSSSKDKTDNNISF